MINQENINCVVVGLGYVGLPLAVEFAKYYSVIGYDLDAARIGELKENSDRTMEVSEQELERAMNLSFTSDDAEIRDGNVYIITVPTPITSSKIPDLRPLLSASLTVGNCLKKGDVVIYESTVYPGATEDDCVPILEQASGLKFNEDFFVGYSPERINPGDAQHRLTDIIKVTSGSTDTCAQFVDDLYSKVIVAGTHKASSIKVAEAAKVIENTQRDVNIALINELSIIFNLMEIDTEEVLNAAATKWNFLSFSPGLVGGHCIGVDPYYLTHKAQSLGYQPDVILSGRRVNDQMGRLSASKLIKSLIKRKINLHTARVLILGLAFKENCPDLRNTKVVDIYHELLEHEIQTDVHDSIVDPKSACLEYGITLQNSIEFGSYDAIILAVPHNEYLEAGAAQIKKYGKDECVFFDLKSVFNIAESDLRL